MDIFRNVGITLPCQNTLNKYTLIFCWFIKKKHVLLIIHQSLYFPDLRLKSTVIIISSLFIWQLIFDFFHKRFCLLLVFHWQKKCWSRQQLSLDKHDKKGSAVQFLCFKKYFLQFSSHNMMWRVGLTWMIIYVFYKICATKCDSFFSPEVCGSFSLEVFPARH